MASGDTTDGRRLVGRVVKPHGLRGEVVVESLTDLVERWQPGSVLYAPDRTLHVAASRHHQGRVLVQFEQVTDRNAAERLRGLELEADAVDPEDYDTYFVHELVGLAVLDEEGATLGEVDGVVELPAAAGYDLFEVRRPDGSTFLLPGTDDYVEVQVDPDGTASLVVVEPPQGLLDAGEPEA